MRTEPDWNGPQFRAGVHLYLHSLWRMFRMRKVWIVLIVLGFLYTGLVLSLQPRHEHDSWSPGKVIVYAYRERHGFLSAWDSVLRWRDPYRLGLTVTQGTSRIWAERIAIPINILNRKIDQYTGAEPTYSSFATATATLLAIILGNLLGALLTAGLLGWIYAGIRGEPSTIRNGIRYGRRGVWLIYGWFIFLDIFNLFIYAAIGHTHDAELPTIVRSVVAVLLFTMTLLPSVAITDGFSLSTFRTSLRLFASRFWMLLGVLLAFRLTYLVLACVSKLCTMFSIGYGHADMWAKLMIVIVTLTSHLLLSGLALSISIAFLLLVVRSQVSSSIPALQESTVS